MNVSPLRDFIVSLADEATPIEWAIQAGLSLAAVGTGWILSGILCARFHPDPRWKFGEGEARRVIFPLLSVLFAWFAKAGMGHLAQHAALITITVSLLFAFLMVRLAVYILGLVLPHGATLRLVVRAIAWIAWIAAALHITGLLPEVREGLDDVAITVGVTRISLLLAIQALGAVALTLTLTLWIARVAGGRVLAAESVEISTRVVIVKIFNTIAIVLAVLIALPMAGVDITALSVFGGALAVGLGFGLQKVAASYVSGFIVLLERSLRIGDVITLENRRGVVEAIESRYTVLKSGDGTETIIPNESLITKEVVHHTYTDPRVATTVAFAVPYETDADAACELLMAIGGRAARVLRNPAPFAKLTGLGENGIQMELTVWISDPEKGESDLRSELLKDILRTFKAQGIAISAPRRDVRMIATPETHKIVNDSMT